MGYSTDFNGSLTLSKPLTEEQFDYINKFSQTRRMKRDTNKLMEKYKGKFGYPVSQSTSLPPSTNGNGILELNPETNTFEETNRSEAEKIYGVDGEFFVGGGGFAGQDHDETVIDHNIAPGQLIPDYKSDNYMNTYNENQKRASEGLCQPGLWCQWIVTQEGVEQRLEWDGGEKFYNYVEWLRYLIKNFFQPWGVLLNGVIEWEGESGIHDLGRIEVKDNVVTVRKGHVNYE